MNKPSSCSYPKDHLLCALRGRAQAAARITGGEGYPDISGVVRFFQTNKGVVVCAEICGLPRSGRACQEQIFGFHIHQGTDCGGSADEPFANVMQHYDVNGCEHPGHAGDLPPLFGNDGIALSACLTSRFMLDEVIGRTVIIHDHPDDLMTQPSGNSGVKIACGVIRRTTAACR